MALSPSDSAAGQKKVTRGASGSSGTVSTVYSSEVPSLMHLAAIPCHSFSNEGIEPPRDFLSLYSDPSSQRSEQRLNQGVSTYLTTQNFLPPLERGGNNRNAKADGSSTAAAALDEHILPGGIGTYSVSHISSGSQANGKSELPVNALTQVNGAEGKLDVTRGRTRGSSGSGMFTLRGECSVMDGGRALDGLGECQSTKVYLEKSGHWASVRPKTGMTDLSFHAKNSFGHSSLDITRQPVPSSRMQGSHTGQGFIKIMKKPNKFLSEDDEDEDEEYLDRNRENRKEGSFPKGEVPPKEDGKSNDLRTITPRSKHSATEQRRRSKINDRFQTLRELVPHSDQKRDKASFLLEVIEYLQVLQEKVQKYETAEQCWNQEKMKSMAWDLHKRSAGLQELPVDSSGTDGTHSESKQTSEAGDLNRPRLSSAAAGDEHVGMTADLLPNSSQNSLLLSVSSPIRHGCASLYVENGSTGSFNKPTPHTPSMQHSICTPNERSFTHSIHPKVQAVSENNSLPCMQTISAGSCMPTNVWFLDKERPTESAGADQLSHLQGNNNNAAEASEGLENQRPDLRLSPKLLTQQDPGWNQGTSVKDDETETQLPTKLEHQRVNTCFNNLVRISQSESEPEAELTRRQSQHPAISNVQWKADESESAVNEHEQLVIQGGIINVSSIYSQGLLDALTRALQSSGLDLSQANISVQIDLGRRGGTSVAAIKPKELIQNQEESPQNRRLQGQLRSADAASECERLPKRPKIEHHI